MPLNQIKSNLVDMVLTRHTPLSMTTICKNLNFFNCPLPVLHTHFSPILIFFPGKMSTYSVFPPEK